MKSLTFLTEKLNVRIKGRACANGIIQQDWMNK